MTNLRTKVLLRGHLLPLIVAGLKVLLPLSTFFLLGGPAEAQEPTSQPPILTATEFLARVEKANPRLDLLEGIIDLEVANITAAGQWSNPSLTYDREEIFGDSRSFPENILRLDLPLEISGRRGLRVDAAELGVRAARQAADRDKKSVLIEALGVYLRAAAVLLKLEVLREERVALGRLVEAIDARASAGDASGYDLDRLTIEVESLDDLINDAERELFGYRKALGLLTGDPSAQFDAGDVLALPSTGSGTRTGQLVLASHPGYSAAGFRAQQADLMLQAAGRGWVPTLSLSGGAKSAVIDADTRWGYVVGLSLNLPLLDYGQADAERARAQLRSARAEQRLVEQQIRVAVELASEGLTHTADQARRYEKAQLPRLDRLIRRAEVSYQEGERPVFELLDAYRTARGGRLRAIDLRLQTRLAELELWRARGLSPGGTR